MGLRNYVAWAWTGILASILGVYGVRYVYWALYKVVVLQNVWVLCIVIMLIGALIAMVRIVLIAPAFVISIFVSLLSMAVLVARPWSLLLSYVVGVGGIACSVGALLYAFRSRDRGHTRRT